MQEQLSFKDDGFKLLYNLSHELNTSCTSLHTISPPSILCDVVVCACIAHTSLPQIVHGLAYAWFSSFAKSTHYKICVSRTLVNTTAVVYVISECKYVGSCSLVCMEYVHRHTVPHPACSSANCIYEHHFGLWQRPIAYTSKYLEAQRERELRYNCGCVSLRCVSCVKALDSWSNTTRTSSVRNGLEREAE